MANWKKMAEAFGRAVSNRERLVEHAPRTQKGFDKASAKDAIEDERFRRSAVNAGAEEEFRRGFNDDQILPDRGGRASRIQSNRGDFVEQKDLASADREQSEFDKVFDDAVNEATARHSGGAAESGTERIRADMRRQAIEMLKNEKYDISDILDYLQPYRTGDK